ncbi:MAG TPA: hypothetical protein VFL82_16510 [Thermomicrobiales bacterium]|nr:hypothetical protein [Thermomicrobiales bacterium]
MPSADRFDWSRLDPYMESLAETGADIVAAITLKPPCLFPTIDESVWQPSDIKAWQHLVAELVRRYSVERRIVTHWEIMNEPDIGETGGSPYLITDPTAYADLYRVTIEPILDVFPDAKVGGTANARVASEPLPGFIDICRRDGVQLDFVSWHLYSSDPHQHAEGVERIKQALAMFPDQRPEMMVTEWSSGFDRITTGDAPPDGHRGRPLSLAELSVDPSRAAVVAASIIAMHDAGLDWSFYYHIWDQVFLPNEFRSFFSNRGIDLMYEHWNETPHRFGLFGVEGEVRPQYFVYQMLAAMGDTRIKVAPDDPDRISVLSGRDDRQITTFLTTGGSQRNEDQIAVCHYSGLDPGPKQLTVYRLDGQQRWSNDGFVLQPIEQREIYAQGDFRHQIYVPKDSVILTTLDDLPSRQV